MKKIFLAALLLVSVTAFATGLVVEPDWKVSTQVVGGKDSNNAPQTFRVDSLGNLLTKEGSATAAGTLTQGNQNIAAAGATDRQQMPTVTAVSCTLQAQATNAGRVYVGGSTVTNASGANKGISLNAGDSISNLTLSNLNTVYVAADNVGDDVAYLCN